MTVGQELTVLWLNTVKSRRVHQLHRMGAQNCVRCCEMTVSRCGVTPVH